MIKPRRHNASAIARAATIGAFLFVSVVAARAQDATAGSGTDSLLVIASQAIAAKNYPVAIDAYTQVLAKDAKNNEAIYNRAVCWLATGDHDRALEGLSASIELEPDYPISYLNRGSILANRKEYAGAVRDFTRAIEIDSNSVSAYYMRGQILLQINRISEAILDLQRALSMEGATERTGKIVALLDMIGFRPLSGESATYRNDDANISLELPKEWHRKTADDGKTLNMFVSQQKVEKEGDMFMVGASIHRIRRMSASFEHIQKDGAWLAGYWSAALEAEGAKLHKYRVVSSEEVSVGKHVGIVRLVELQHAEDLWPVRMYEVVVGHDDEIVTMNLEAPARLFGQYEAIFKKALASLVIE